MNRPAFNLTFSSFSRRFPIRPFAAAMAPLLVLLLMSMDAGANAAGEPSGIKIVIVGATSKTANELIPQALWRGHEVNRRSI